MSTSYIAKYDFDWDYYLTKNPDLRKAGLNNLDKCYRHWITYGCYENRCVKSIKSGIEQQVKLKPNEKFNQSQQVSSSIQGPAHSSKIVDLKFKIAVMIHVFDVTMMRFFVSYANYLNKQYNRDNFDIYFNIVEENNPYQDQACAPGCGLKDYVQEYLSQIDHPKVECRYSANRGGDIGGFLILSKTVINTTIDYKYVIFIHSKNKSNWRKDLCHCIFDINFQNLEKTPDVGMISSNKWIKSFDPVKQPDEYRRFNYHMVDLCQIYGLSIDKPFKFVAGTMFLAKMDIIQFIVSHEIDRVYQMLNRVDSIDINWVTIMDELHKDRLGTYNDYQYRLKFKKSLLSDYMIEHTYERVLGLLCEQRGLKLMGQ
jgi:hypothetical protein